mgnify:CR=1 FL=1
MPGEHERSTAQYASQCDTQKDRNQIRVIQSFHRVAQYFFRLAPLPVHCRQSLHGHPSANCRWGVATRSTPERFTRVILTPKSLRILSCARAFPFSSGLVIRIFLEIRFLFLKIPFHIYLFAKENGNCLHVYRVGNDKNFIIQMKDCI